MADFPGDHWKPQFLAQQRKKEKLKKLHSTIRGVTEIIEEGVLKPNLITLGHIINEIIKFPDRTVGPVLGSPAAYSAVTASRLGMETGIVTKIGTDMPKSLLSPFFESNVDTQGIIVEGNDSTTNLLFYDTLGNKNFHFLKKAPKIVFDDIPEEYLQAKMIHVCPMTDEVPIETIERLSDLEVLLSIDLNFLTTMQKSYKAFMEIIRHFNIVKSSLENLNVKKGAEENIARLFLRWGVDISIISLGEKGSLVVTEDGRFEIPAFPVKVVDVTGAGDAYTAGFLVEYLKTGDAKRSALFASATASLVIEGTGGVTATRFPRASEVYARISHS